VPQHLCLVVIGQMKIDTVVMAGYLDKYNAPSRFILYAFLLYPLNF
jgi:hypothetical protein